VERIKKEARNNQEGSPKQRYGEAITKRKKSVAIID
jgi:hypothetical protein